VSELNNYRTREVSNSDYRMLVVIR